MVALTCAVDTVSLVAFVTFALVGVDRVGALSVVMTIVNAQSTLVHQDH